jgi:hypothetical protein
VSSHTHQASRSILSSGPLMQYVPNLQVFFFSLALPPFFFSLIAPLMQYVPNLQVRQNQNRA